MDVLKENHGSELLINPIVESGADPWVIRFKDSFYYCRADDTKISVSTSLRLQDVGTVPRVTVWKASGQSSHFRNMWAPELHYLEGKWFIYFAADDGRNVNHRMYVLEADSEDPQHSYSFKGRIAPVTDRWAIDGTVLTVRGSRYFTWSGWESFENHRQNLYIARMNTPWSISGDRSCISTPQYAWEKRGVPQVNEAPQVLKKRDRVFIIYSASGSWTDDYCLGQLALIGNDPLKRESWLKKDKAVFSKTSEVFGPGHACFVTSANGEDDWIVYHAAKYAGAGWDRNVRAQKFTWNDDGSPNFGVPIPPGIPIT